MEQLIDFFRNLGNSDAFMPRWVCGKWSEFHGWTYIIADLIIFLAYMAIPIGLFIFLRKRWDDVPFKNVFWLFISFITLCGTTHLLDAVIFYIPLYRLNALVLMVTAIVSMATVVAVIRVLPEALRYSSPKELKRVVREKTEELKERIDELDHLSKRVSRKKEQLEQFAYITSHNLRAPAANLSSLTNLLESSQDEATRTSVIQKIRESSEVLLNTINDVSHVVTHSSPQLPASVQNFEKLVDEILLHHEDELKGTDLRIVKEFEVKDLLYPPDHMRNVVQNLIDNAFTYRSHERSLELRLRTFVEEGRVKFECEDNGLGIDMQKYGTQLFKLYKTFHDLPTSRGIGLFLVRNQLTTLGGSVEVVSEVNVGTKFTVTFGDKLNKE